ncbi:NYN domain-containing protein [Aeoliella sp.]|uniref:NYN domain-containing protein n=1 Tax=Aeoliella sp. TaxID=2795800 RepID=UPI003CCBCA03
MRLLIDGYNLMHATYLFGSGNSAGTLHGAREAMLAFLASALSAGERRGTTIVFDAAGAPPGLPKTVHHDHLTIRYAREYADADALLEEIIERHRAPRGLTVVSSDHRVQRAARRRGCKYIDSDVWYRELSTRRAHRSNQQPQGKPQPGGSVDYWVEQFTNAEAADLEAELRAIESPKLKPKTTKRKPHAPPTAEGSIENPFPPGYGEDLLEE